MSDQTPASDRLNQQMGLSIPDDRIRQRSDGLWQVASRTEFGRWYTVTENGHCSCEAAENGHSCWHVELLVDSGKISI